MSTPISGPAQLRELLHREPPAPAEEERCELCGEPVDERHGHLVDLENRNILCACRPCSLLFDRPGAGGARFRAIGERYRYDPEFAISPAAWAALGFPVRMAFIFHNSAQERDVAFYPSPAGATESLLPLDDWARILAENPSFADTAPDVEAVLLHHLAPSTECFGVPIDACYRLVGLVKLHWRGFDGGTEAWEAIDGFFEELRARCEPVGAAAQGGGR